MFVDVNDFILEYKVLALAILRVMINLEFVYLNRHSFNGIACDFWRDGQIVQLLLHTERNLILLFVSENSCFRKKKKMVKVKPVLEFCKLNH